MDNKEFSEAIPFEIRVGLVRADVEMKRISTMRKLKLCSDCVVASDYLRHVDHRDHFAIEKVLEKFEPLIHLDLTVPTNRTKMTRLLDKYEIYNQYDLEEIGLGGGWMDFKDVSFVKGM